MWASKAHFATRRKLLSPRPSGRGGLAASAAKWSSSRADEYSAHASDQPSIELVHTRSAPLGGVRRALRRRRREQLGRQPCGVLERAPRTARIRRARHRVHPRYGLELLLEP